MEFNDAMTSNDIGLFAFELIEDTNSTLCMPPSATVSNCVPGFEFIKKDDIQPFYIYTSHSIANKSQINRLPFKKTYLYIKFIYINLCG